MTNDPSIQSAVQQYLDVVATSLVNVPAERCDTLLAELREHIHEAIAVRTSGKPATLQDAYAVLSEMDLPEDYADTPTGEREKRKLNPKLVALAWICAGLQIVGLAAIVAGIPGVAGIAGLAAIVVSFLIWSGQLGEPRWLRRPVGVAGLVVTALCGLGLIVLELIRAS